MLRAAITAIDYFLPEGKLTNEQLAIRFPDWTAVKIEEKTGIRTRRIAALSEFSSDLAVAAATKLFAASKYQPSNIDFVLLCTQTPDFALPTTACLIQSRLGIPSTAGALDFNLGCSGYVYGLSLAKGLIESNQARCVLFLTAETYSKLIAPNDKSVSTIFGDAGAATIVSAEDTVNEYLGPFVFGTNGFGGANLVCHRGGLRGAFNEAAGRDTLWMDGPEIFNFALKVVPKLVDDTLARAGMSKSDIDMFVFHQANRYMLEHLRKKLGLHEGKFFVSMEHCGNTVSSSIPIALRDAQTTGRLKSGMRLMLVGFGAGYSWSATLAKWP
jgi:3-oxoacyl-[acyl-carrier-protein] synthase-3